MNRRLTFTSNIQQKKKLIYQEAKNSLNKYNKITDLHDFSLNNQSPLNVFINNSAIIMKQNFYSKLIFLKSKNLLKNKQKFNLLALNLKSSGITLNEKDKITPQIINFNKKTCNQPKKPFYNQVKSEKKFILENNTCKYKSKNSAPQYKQNQKTQPNSKTKNSNLKNFHNEKSHNKNNQKEDNFSKLVVRPIFNNQKPPLKSFASLVISYPEKTVYLSHHAQISIEVASLTKIMTCYCIIKLCQTFNIPISTQEIVVPYIAEGIKGTTCQIIANQIYTIQQLLYGLMLPSGNDAAIALAIWGGKLIAQKFIQKQNKIKNNQSIQRFLAFMNKKGRQLGLKNTRYLNPHGLCNSQNRSSAADIAILCCQALKSELFQTIVSTKEYSLTIRNTEGFNRTLKWKNTNKLLGKEPGFKGIKTGQTTSAGPCLASFYNKEISLIIVVLNSIKMNKRFVETNLLVKWTKKMMGIKQNETRQNLIQQHYQKI